ncbi:hypothetical protein LTR37_000114 [Vermiconidia calcicola]|uniref:Uncharacterized protein n=1 Tax=Vermiconidia calcicola TaxID=1690605 RepID=A0ACC3NZJ9_9PEZI|nr:hypothetical protein LTR37_000114 [Vermiconidia calcicola]
MRISGLFFRTFCFLLLPAIVATLFLYFYAPLFVCSFPTAKRADPGSSLLGAPRDAILEEVAPFRLLALADPQLEGDTSLPDPDAPAFPSLVELWSRLEDGQFSTVTDVLFLAAGHLVTQDVPKLLKGYRKRIDLWGNDLYLAHIYRSVSWWAEPTHTVVLGDLLGSQWIGDEEFARRSERFWNRVYRGAEKAPRTTTDSRKTVEVLGQDESWRRTLITVAGNHDIGYAGDIDEHRIERFEDAYGSVNWETTFIWENATSQSANSTDSDRSKFPSSPPELHLVMLNSMNLDSPAYNTELQQQSRDFLEAQLYHSDHSARSESATILLTHIPFHKEAGVCMDPPFFDWFPEDQGGGIREQNHLSKQTSDFILSGLAGGSKRGKAIILNGHDHEGCDTYHYRALDTGDDASEEAFIPPAWEAKYFGDAFSEVANDSLHGLREITVRSMMGSYGGNAGFLSAWFDENSREWKFAYNSCMLGVQHFWWAVHVLDLVVLGLGLASLVAGLVEVMQIHKEDGEEKKLKQS